MELTHRALHSHHGDSVGPTLTLKSAFQTGTLGNSACPVSEDRLSSSWPGPRGMWRPKERNSQLVLQL